MDKQGRIYESENVTPEDKARLEGYLIAQVEAERAAMLQRIEEEAEKRARSDVG